MAIGATESCNACDNAELAGKPHVHGEPDMCGRRMYHGDFFCTCEEAAGSYRCRICSGKIAVSVGANHYAVEAAFAAHVCPADHKLWRPFSQGRID
jgi:hypothetical protein